MRTCRGRRSGRLWARERNRSHARALRAGGTCEDRSSQRHDESSSPVTICRHVDPQYEDPPEHSRRKSTSVLTSTSKQFPVRRLEILEILNDRFARCGSKLIGRLIPAGLRAGYFCHAQVTHRRHKTEISSWATFVPSPPSCVATQGSHNSERCSGTQPLIVVSFCAGFRTTAPTAVASSAVAVIRTLHNCRNRNRSITAPSADMARGRSHW